MGQETVLHEQRSVLFCMEKECKSSARGRFFLHQRVTSTFKRVEFVSDRLWYREHCRKLHDFHFSPNILRVIKFRRMRWAGHVARMGDRRGAYSVSVGQPEGKRPLRRPKRGWEDNIKMDLKEILCQGVHCINLAQDGDTWRTFVKAVINQGVP
jgi:hypothetical protein